jgi:toxin ParE1/3/4
VILFWTDNALNDLDRIDSYISQDSEESAIRTLELLLAAAENLPKFPEMGRVGRVARTRERIVPPYILQYKIQNTEIRILGIIHGAREWPD